jgi:hypothetical protein
MLARFHIAEEFTRGPFGVQTRQNLDSSQRLLMSWSGRWATFARLHLIFRELHEALMAVPTTKILPAHVANQSQELCQP